MSKNKKALLSCIVLPLMRMLLLTDSRPAAFREKTMMPGLYGIVRK
jgi:hypothetical protein